MGCRRGFGTKGIASVARADIGDASFISIPSFDASDKHTSTIHPTTIFEDGTKIDTAYRRGRTAL